MDTATNIFDIALPVYARTACSPKLERDFIGFKILGPDSVSLSKNGKVPICGAFRISNTVHNILGSNLTEETTIVFVNKKTNIPFSFNLVPDKEPVEGGRKDVPDNLPELSVENIIKEEDVMIIKHFNVDALMFNDNFPDEEAVYMVYGVNRSLKSNVIEIEIKN
ncbi:hypothetical protein MNBD_GAMMA08-2632 [hydrothermal vent metagenome]|uniref:Uncharacterized protein n=1 Tax=hydrothermal vent metagenome TaxID=652676 RepID=A0A3B0X4T3_9ZZZZ